MSADLGRTVLVCFADTPEYMRAVLYLFFCGVEEENSGGGAKKDFLKG